MSSYVIIGNGVAGATAAERIRRGDSHGRITVFSREKEPFYYRPRLIDYLSGDMDLAKITLHDVKWYQDRNIALRLGESIAEVDLAKGLVRSDKGLEAAFDSLLLSTGARPFIPPVPGADRPGVFALRDAEDARAITARARNSRAAVLLGGGLLGLEAGAALAKLGVRIQVVEIFDRLLPRQMDPAAAAKLQKRLEGMGFSFCLGCKAKEIGGSGEELILTLDTGDQLRGGLILFSAGIRPNLDLAQAMGLDVDKGVKVDDRLMTSKEGVWAAGDLIEHRGRVYGIWPASKEQGEVAGSNMAGEAALYQGTVMQNSLKVVGVDLTAAGEIDAEGKLASAVYEEEEAYRKIVLQDGRIAGFIFYGLTQGVKECQKALEEGREVGRHLADMKKKDFDFGKLVG